MIYKGYGNWWKCHWDKRKLPTHCISEEAFIPLSPKASLIFQFIHLYIHPSIDPSIHHLSIHPSAAALIHPYIHPPKSSHSMSQLPPPVKTKMPLGFVDQKTWGPTTNGKRHELVGERGRSLWGGDGWVRRKDREGPSVRSHWGQGMAATFTKPNSPEEQSTSPVAVDYSIITSASLTVSHFNHSLFKIHTTCRVAAAIKC